MGKILKLVLISVIWFSVIGCSGSSDDKKDTTTTAKEMSKEETNKKLQDISIWVIGDYWNDSLCDLVWYINSGTSSVGGELDSDVSFKKYNDEFKKVEDYNKFISALSDDEYKDVKESWATMYAEMNTLNEYIKTNGVNANADPDFNADLFSQYRNAFSEAVNKVNGVE